MGHGTVNTGYPIKKDWFDPAGAAQTAVSEHNSSGTAHADIRAAMVTATVQVSYNEGMS